MIELEFELLFRLSSDNNRRLAVVKGLPGGGKTRTTLANTVLYSNLAKVVYAAPLRSLRNYWAKQYGMEVIKSRDEVCPAVKYIEAEDTVDYLVACARICRGCQKTCEFKEAFKNFIKSSRGLFALTHKMLLVLYTAAPRAFQNTLLIIDEADSLFDQWSIVCEYSKLKELWRTGDPLTRKVVKRLAKNCFRFGKYVYFKPIVPLTRITFLVSATLPPELLELMPLPENTPCTTIYIKSEFKDIILWSRKTLKWSEKDEWLPTVLKTIKEYSCKFRKIGIASRNYTLTKILHEYMEASFKVTSDYYDKKPRAAEVYIWTTRGKWYRGISLPDTDIVFCFYQYPLETKPLNPLVLRTIVEKDIEYFKLLNNAVNTQSYFRSNRKRSKTHVIVLLDRRSYHALHTTIPQEYLKKTTRKPLE
ncbi:MAG: hypothetical protein DRN04_10825 [Thermoprotei archaeon]|nr:MAG: hypothetical protein DRN04_10825 [Thermoprotei archaeon]